LSLDFVSATITVFLITRTYKGEVGTTVESGCERIYNDQNRYFLDFKLANRGIFSLVRVWLFSINLLLIRD
jgi:hypothetical protein